MMTEYFVDEMYSFILNYLLNLIIKHRYKIFVIERGKIKEIDNDAL